MGCFFWVSLLITHDIKSVGRTLTFHYRCLEFSLISRVQWTVLYDLKLRYFNTRRKDGDSLWLFFPCGRVNIRAPVKPVLFLRRKVITWHFSFSWLLSLCQARGCYVTRACVTVTAKQTNVSPTWISIGMNFVLRNSLRYWFNSQTVGLCYDVCLCSNLTLIIRDKRISLLDCDSLPYLTNCVPTYLGPILFCFPIDNIFKQIGEFNTSLSHSSLLSYFWFTSVAGTHWLYPSLLFILSFFISWHNVYLLKKTDHVWPHWLVLPYL